VNIGGGHLSLIVKVQLLLQVRLRYKIWDVFGVEDSCCVHLGYDTV